jgi:hypothetical protein
MISERTSATTGKRSIAAGSPHSSSVPSLERTAPSRTGVSDSGEPLPTDELPSDGTDGEEETGLGGDFEGEDVDEATEVGLDDAAAEGAQADELFDPSGSLVAPPDTDEPGDAEGLAAAGGDEDMSLEDLGSALDDEPPAPDALGDDYDLELDEGGSSRDGGEEGLDGEEETLDEPPLRSGDRGRARGGGTSDEDGEEGDEGLERPLDEELDTGLDGGLDEELRPTEGAGTEALRWEDRAWQWTLGPIVVGKVTALRVVPEGALVDAPRGTLLVGPDGRVTPARDPLGAEPDAPDLGDFVVAGDRLLRRQGGETVPVPGLSGVLRASPGPGGGVLACVFDEPHERVLLVRVDVAGIATVVGDVSGDLAAHAEGTLAADAEDVATGVRLAFDEARGWVWLAGSFGVAAYRR